MSIDCLHVWTNNNLLIYKQLPWFLRSVKKNSSDIARSKP